MITLEKPVEEHEVIEHDGCSYESLSYLIDEIIYAMFFKKNVVPYAHLSEFITHEKESAYFVNSIIGDELYGITPDDDSIEDAQRKYITQNRAQHVAITYLMGLVFWKFTKAIYGRMSESKTEATKRCWTTTALYHDNGYFRTSLSDSNYNYKEKVDYDLLVDNYEEIVLRCLNNYTEKYPDDLAYTYDEILAYNEFRKSRKSNHKGNKSKYEEINDHGILGAVLGFDEIVKKGKSRNAPSEFYIEGKKACLSIAQHNIFKSNDKKTDRALKSAEKFKKLYEKLHSGSEFKISKGTPLLLFLSLIDTVECVKKFSGKEVARAVGKEKADKYFQTLTVLRKVFVYITEEFIRLDFSRLRDEWNNKLKGIDDLEQRGKIDKIFDGYLSSLYGLSTWTEFRAKKIGENLIEISLDDSISHK